MSYLPSQYRSICLPFDNVIISGNGSPADRAVLQVPAGINYWLPRTQDTIQMFFESTGGSIAAGTIDLYTQTGGLGTSLLGGAQTLTALTETGKYQGINATSMTNIITNSGIYIRQLGNANGTNGTIQGGVWIDVLG